MKGGGGVKLNPQKNYRLKPSLIRINDNRNRPLMNKNSLSEAMRKAYHDFNRIFWKLIYIYAFPLNVSIMTI